MNFETKEINLHGLIDMHIHTSPDVNIRSMDDIQAARDAVDSGMSSIVYKSHVTITSDRATIAESVVQGIHIFGGIVLNEAVGGINPFAVEAALKLGAKVIWMPTFSAHNHIIKHGGKQKGLSVVNEEGKLREEMHDIFELMKQHQPVLATCHLSVPEILTLIREATKKGLVNIVVTHPESQIVNMPTSLQCELCTEGVYFERCYVSTFPIGGNVPFQQIVSDIREVGVESTILATDFGVSSLPPAIHGMKSYIKDLFAAGFSEQDIRIMAKENPTKLLNLTL